MTENISKILSFRDTPLKKNELPKLFTIQRGLFNGLWHNMDDDSNALWDNKSKELLTLHEDKYWDNE